MIHELKTMQPYFDDIATCKKTFEVRKSDRPFTVGDFFALNEYDPIHGYSGRCLIVQVTYILNEVQYCKDDFVILGIDGACIMTHQWINRPPQDLAQMMGIPVYDRE